MSYRIPASYDHKYYVPSLDLKASIEKEISGSFIFGVETRYSFISFKREMKPGDENSLLKSYAETLNKKINTSAFYIGLKAGFGF
ncbi:MAG: hypothetical protein K6357_06130 [Elusimicrobiota bacterium]